MSDSTDLVPDSAQFSRGNGQRYDKPDFILQGIIAGLNDRGTGDLTITVQTHGMLVSGKLIGGKEYFYLLGEQFASANGTDPSRVGDIRDEFRGFANIYDKEKSPIPASAGDPSYIHLKDAKFFSSRGMSITDGVGVLWRGRLIEVSGFFIGEIILTED
jgi:hypothetical protein